MSESLRIGCKVNLYLEITGIRENGYHEIETLFYPVPEPHDTLELEISEESEGLLLSCSDKTLQGSSNLVAKAYEAYAAKTGFRPGLTARLEKGIPSGAGLGGGSADAAALLGWLNARAKELGLSPDELDTLAAGLGADVTFFLSNTPAWATGIGDILEAAVDSLSGFAILICVPSVRVNTAWAYKAWDQAQGHGAALGASQPLTRLFPASIRPFCVSGALIANCFEQVVFQAYPAVRLLKERLLNLGAASACMSGSGSAVFGIFRDPARADAAASELNEPEVAVFSTLL